MNRLATVGLVALGQLALVGVAVAPQISARVAGDTYQLRVQPLDPIDPFRGAYVTLGYPDLQRGDSQGFDGGLGDMTDDEAGDVFITLREEGDVWVADSWERERPDDGPYLACDDRDWQIRCGIESWFLPQDEAAAMERNLVNGAIATVKIDSRGHAAVVDVE
ncbi:hypothetical protein DDE18_03105 [Nocardioides gansuensis]|uniref:GDYXXLXY domain-containing protein n=1 Tax=Nocardioides gansuensis TaxID=2138300 RepID=A0A2T8FFW8_9ACTN|nr:GDYXXLXY domain-containing protein [Nocardioides gansuensis]PVG84603.1 hypothetical protein DDE18_03105 [Nocardioides gansuensis]